MNHPNGQSSSRRDMISRLGESTTEMLSFDSVRGLVDSRTTPTNTAAARGHLHEGVNPADRVRWSPSRNQPPLEQLKRDRPCKSPERKKSPLASPTKVVSSTPPLKDIKDICLPALDLDGVAPPSEKAPPSKCFHRNNIEIGDNGASVPLAGAEETINALHNDSCKHATCLACETVLYCIDTASSVICPECRSISPVAAKPSLSSEGLIGLGLTVEHVVEEYQKLDLK